MEVAHLVQLVVNGENRAVRPDTTVATLLGELGLAEQQVAVERNRDIVPRADYGRTILRDQDQLEIVTFVGGG